LGMDAMVRKYRSMSNLVSIRQKVSLGKSSP
jgi:hypothetical protein